MMQMFSPIYKVAVYSCNFVIFLLYHLLLPLFSALWFGMSDAINPQYPIELYYKSRTMRRYFNTFIHWNLFVFVCNALIFFAPSVSGKWFAMIMFLCWFLPVWVISDYINRSVQSEMMLLLCKQKANQTEKFIVERKNDTKPNIANKITDSVYEGVFFTSMHILLFISQNFWSLIFYILGFSLLCSYSLMSYRLNYNNIPLNKKIKLFEKYWLYFLFYGMPYTLIYIILPASLSYPCFHLVSSLTLPNTINALPKKNLQPLKIFYLPELLVNRITIIALYIKENLN